MEYALKRASQKKGLANALVLLCTLSSQEEYNTRDFQIL